MSPEYNSFGIANDLPEIGTGLKNLYMYFYDNTHYMFTVYSILLIIWMIFRSAHMLANIFSPMKETKFIRALGNIKLIFWYFIIFGSFLFLALLYGFDKYIMHLNLDPGIFSYAAPLFMLAFAVNTIPMIVSYLVTMFICITFIKK